MGDQYSQPGQGQPPEVSVPPFPLSAQPPPTGPPLEPPAGSKRRNGNAVAAAVALGLLLIAIVVLATMLATGGDEETAATSIVDATPSTTDTTMPGTDDTADGGTGGDTGGLSDDDVDAAVTEAAREVEVVLTRSAEGRAEVTAVIDGVLSCRLVLEEAADRLGTVLTNREEVLLQIDALGNTGNANLDDAVDLLGESITASLEANAAYGAWIDWISSTQAGFYNGGCLPGGTAPTNADYDDAVAASGRATTAKTEFVSLYNPIATALGLRTWSDSEI